MGLLCFGVGVWLLVEWMGAMAIGALEAGFKGWKSKSQRQELKVKSGGKKSFFEWRW